MHFTTHRAISKKDKWTYSHERNAMYMDTSCRTNVKRVKVVNVTNILQQTKRPTDQQIKRPTNHLTCQPADQPTTVSYILHLNFVRIIKCKICILGITYNVPSRTTFSHTQSTTINTSIWVDSIFIVHFSFVK